MAPDAEAMAPGYGVAAVAEVPSLSVVYFDLPVGIQLKELSGMGWRGRGQPTSTYRLTGTCNHRMGCVGEGDGTSLGGDIAATGCQASRLKTARVQKMAHPALG